ncbi:hypothetical protein BKI52_05030 [marine bacterium AO1-C]|nr:hypothetical protein BKI52_05030 [marine bacterium AO1-C]
MFDTLTEDICKAAQKLNREKVFTDVNVASAIKGIRRSLVRVGVNYKIAKRVTDEMKEEMLELRGTTDVDLGKLFLKIIKEKLCELMGGKTEEINLEGNPVIVLLAGLKKAGKTRFVGKLAGYLKKQKDKRVLLASCDVLNPNAQKELQEIGDWVEATTYTAPENKESLVVAQNAIRHAKEHHFDVVILDTMRSATIDEAFLTEIKNLKDAIQPTETLFVADITTGQEAINAANTFQKQVGLDGIVLTKLDLDMRGGVVILSIREIVGKPVKYTNTGEKMSAVNLFNPGYMASRAVELYDIQKELIISGDPLGLGDKHIDRVLDKIRRPKFDYEDFLTQLKPSPELKKMIDGVPGMNEALEEVSIDEAEIITIEVIICSMTLQERRNPWMLKEISRRERIALGSGTSIQQVNLVTKHLENRRKMLKKIYKRGKNKRTFGNPFE